MHDLVQLLVQRAVHQRQHIWCAVIVSLRAAAAWRCCRFCLTGGSRPLLLLYVLQRKTQGGVGVCMFCTRVWCDAAAGQRSKKGLCACVEDKLATCTRVGAPGATAAGVNHGYSVPQTRRGVSACAYLQPAVELKSQGWALVDVAEQLFGAPAGDIVPQWPYVARRMIVLKLQEVITSKSRVFVYNREPANDIRVVR